MSTRQAVAPAWRKWLIGLECFLVISAFAGGVSLIVDPTGGLLQMPLSLLADTPFRSFLIPGVILTFVVGGSAAVAAAALWRKAPSSFLLCAASGLILFGWITIQVMLIHAFHPLHAIYGGLGLFFLLAGLRLHRLTRRPV